MSTGRAVAPAADLQRLAGLEHSDPLTALHERLLGFGVGMHRLAGGVEREEVALGGGHGAQLGRPHVGRGPHGHRRL